MSAVALGSFRRSQRYSIFIADARNGLLDVVPVAYTRVAEGREVDIIDSRSARTTEAGELRRYDIGKKIKERK